MNLGAEDKATCLKALWRQARRYHLASLQDKNPVIAARHNGYAVALIDAARDLGTEDEFKAATGESLLKMRNEIIAVQDKIESEAFKLLDRLKGAGFKLPFLGAIEASIF